MSDDDPTWPRYDGGENPWGREPEVHSGQGGAETQPHLQRPTPPVERPGPPLRPSPPAPPGRRTGTLVVAVAAVVAALALGIAGIMWLVQPDDPPTEESSESSGDRTDDAAPDRGVSPSPPAESSGPVGSDAAPSQEQSGGTGAPDKRERDPRTAPGYARFLEDLKGQAGSTTVFSATLHDSYAVVDLPVDRSTDRMDGWYWDGETGQLDEWSGKGTSTYERVDLADIDPELVGRLARRVKKLVEDPTSGHVIIEGRDSVFDDPAQVRAYASNEYSEGAYIAARLDGTIIRTTRY